MAVRQGDGSGRVFRGVLLGMVALMPGMLLAQEVPGPGEEVPPLAPVEERRVQPEEVDEITVTGTRSDVTDIQRDASAITAFSMEELDRANIINVDQLAFNVPALHVGQLGVNSIITLRGIGTENATITGEPGLAFHVDGVNFGRPAAARVAFFDLEGLQVLRGPQGTLGGKNATAGWIHAVTHKPTDELASEVDVQWGSYNQLRMRGALNIPLSERAHTRLAFYREDRDGYQDNLLFKDEDRDAFDADEFGWRAHLRLQPRDDLDWLFTYNYYGAKGVGAVAEVVGLGPERRCNPIPVSVPGGTGYNPLTLFPSFAGCAANPNRLSFGTIPDPLYAATGFDLEWEPRFQNFENPETAGESRAQAVRASHKPHEIYLDQASGQDNKFFGWTSTLGWDTPAVPLLGETELQSILAFQVTDIATFQDFDGTDIELFFGDIGQRTEQWSHELRWSGRSWDERLDWQTSLFWVRETSDSDTAFGVRLSGATQTVEIFQDTENQSYGLALSTTYSARDDLALTLGGRYTKDVKRNKLLRDNPPGSARAFSSRLGVCDGPAQDLKGQVRGGIEIADGMPDDGIPWCEVSFRKMTGDLTLEWWPQEENLLYGKLASGFKAGGFEQGDTGFYDPESIWAFSLGSKNSFFDERLILNLEAYFYNYRDLQLVLVDGLAVRTDNAHAEVQGVDLEFRAEPLAGLRLNGNVSWMDTEITDYLAVDPVDVIVSANCRAEERTLDPNFKATFPGCAPLDYSGNELSRAPDWSLTIGAEYDIYLGRFGTLTPRIQYYWQDDTWFRAFNRTLEDSGPNTPCPRPQNPGQRNVGCANGKLLNAADARDLQPAYHLTDIKLIWGSPSESWSVEAFVRNLEDEVVYQNVLTGTALLDAPQLAWYGSPRVYGFRIGYRY